MDTSVFYPVFVSLSIVITHAICCMVDLRPLGRVILGLLPDHPVAHVLSWFFHTFGICLFKVRYKKQIHNSLSVKDFVNAFFKFFVKGGDELVVFFDLIGGDNGTKALNIWRNCGLDIDKRFRETIQYFKTLYAQKNSTVQDVLLQYGYEAVQVLTEIYTVLAFKTGKMRGRYCFINPFHCIAPLVEAECKLLFLEYFFISSSLIKGISYNYQYWSHTGNECIPREAVRRNLHK